MSLLSISGLSVSVLSSPVLSAQPIETPPEAIAPPSGAQLLLQQGIDHYEAEQFAAAEASWTQPLTAFTVEDDALHQALVLSNLSLVYQHLGQWPAAKTAIAESFNRLQHQAEAVDSRPARAVLAKALNTQGRLQWAQGASEQALETWRQATAAYAQVEHVTGVVGGLMNQAKALQSLGLSVEAETLLKQVYQILGSQSDARLKATGLRNLGDVLRQVGELGQSRQVLQESLAVTEQFQLPKAAVLLELGNIEWALDKRAIALGKTDEARAHTQAALAFYRQAAAIATSTPAQPLQAQLNQLSLLVETEQWQAAIDLWPSLQSEIADLPPSRATVYAQLNFARSLTKLGIGEGGRGGEGEKGERPIPQDIAQILVKAIHQAQNLQDQRAESHAIGQLGELYELAEQWSEAQTLTQQAILLAEGIVAPDIRYHWEWQLGRLLEKQGALESAIASYTAVVESLDSVRRDLLIINSDVQFSFRDTVEPVYRELVALLLRPNGDAELSQAHLRQAIRETDALQLAKLQNFLRCGLAETVEISEREVDPKAALIYPIILSDRVEVILKAPYSEVLLHYQTPIPKTEVDQILDSLRRELEQRYVSPTGLSLSQQVYDWLIRPAETTLEAHQVKTLVFVLDGALRNIPMASLYDGQRYLVETYAVALTPGLKLIEPQPLAKLRLNALTFGLSEVQPNFPPHQGFAALENVEDELAQIQSQVSSQTFLNRDFTSTALQDQLRSQPFTVVHLATHGQFSSDLAETFVLAWDKRIKVNQLSSLLQGREQHNSEAIQLLVLSACETADGDNRATLGLAGIAVRSGARSTLASLWAVNDRSTVMLMHHFYQILADKSATVTKAEALRRAQLALMATTGYRAPRFWSPYVLVGNWL